MVYIEVIIGFYGKINKIVAYIFKASHFDHFNVQS